MENVQRVSGQEQKRLARKRANQTPRRSCPHPQRELGRTTLGLKPRPGAAGAFAGSSPPRLAAGHVQTPAWALRSHRFQPVSPSCSNNRALIQAARRESRLLHGAARPTGGFGGLQLDPVLSSRAQDFPNRRFSQLLVFSLIP